jgi:hypothetical protein
LFALSSIFQRYLRDYAALVLVEQLPSRQRLTSTVRRVSDATSPQADTVLLSNRQQPSLLGAAAGTVASGRLLMSVASSSTSGILQDASSSLLESTRSIRASMQSNNIVQNFQNLVKDGKEVAGSIFGVAGGELGHVTSSCSAAAGRATTGSPGDERLGCAQTGDPDVSSDIVKVCWILCTAEYCLETCMQLEGEHFSLCLFFILSVSFNL